MNTLTINAGSSSVKFALFEDTTLLVEGMIDRIGPKAMLVLGEWEKVVKARDHAQAGKAILEHLKGHKIDRVVHRIVHGAKHDRPVKITPKILRELRELRPLAPLHLPPSIALIEFFHKNCKATHLACFDTAFHRTMPESARTYALPKAIRDKHHIERYGFHGLAHASLAKQAAKALKKPLSKLNVITCQLGAGSSMCAIRDGKSVDTSMGYTPLAGLVMATRSGSIDPAIPLILCEKGLSPKKVHAMLEHESGLLALAGSMDVRDLLKRKDAQAKLALEIYAHSVRKFIGSYVAILGRVDAIVLGGGIAKSEKMRALILEDLDHIGIALDARKNIGESPGLIGSGKTKAFSFQPDEQREMLDEVAHL